MIITPVCNAILDKVTIYASCKTQSRRGQCLSTNTLSSQLLQLVRDDIKLSLPMVKRIIKDALRGLSELYRHDGLHTGESYRL